MRQRSPRIHQSEDITSYFDRSASVVQTYADRFEHEYARPALKTSQMFFQERPIFAIFMAIFSLLSFIPVISFIGFSLFSMGLFTVVALSCAFLASTAVVLIFLSLLAFTLLTTLCLSAILTVLFICVYLSVRFTTLIREEGRAGISDWATETKRHIFPADPQPEDAEDAEDTEYAEDDIQIHDSPEESLFIVKQEQDQSDTQDEKHTIDDNTKEEE